MVVESRKIQVTGGSTFIVSLPKQWIEKWKLKPRSIVYLYEKPDGTLVIAPSRINIEEEKPREAVVKVFDSIATTLRVVISHYISGYDIITVIGKGPYIPLDYRNTIKDIVKKRLAGTEIIDETAQRITLQVLLRHEDFPITRAVNRMLNIALSMHSDAIAAAYMRSKELLNEVIARDDDVDRLYFLSMRQLTAAVQDMQVLKEIGLSGPRDCLEYRMITRHIERVADHAVIIARSFLEVLEDLTNNVIDRLKAISEMARESLKLAYEALLKQSLSKAESALLMRDKVLEEEMNVIEKLLSAGLSSHAIAELRLAVESIRRVAEYGAGIAEIGMNLASTT
ncbi:MAG: PhoU domain-containing protein [Candidatus Nezhaarchaeales archaeon]